MIRLLIGKLDRYGLRGKVKEWIASYPSFRSQVVEVNGSQSEALNLHLGVPQGSILGPLLFIIFANDLPIIVDFLVDLTMFADDNTWLCHDSSLDGAIRKLQDMLNKFHLWFTQNRLCLNSSKTVFVQFTPRHQ